MPDWWGESKYKCSWAISAIRSFSTLLFLSKTKNNHFPSDNLHGLCHKSFCLEEVLKKVIISVFIELGKSILTSGWTMRLFDGIIRSDLIGLRPVVSDLSALWLCGWSFNSFRLWWSGDLVLAMLFHLLWLRSLQQLLFHWRWHKFLCKSAAYELHVPCCLNAATDYNYSTRWTQH